MRKALAIFLFILVVLSPVLAGPPSQGDEFMGKFIEAINTGNYSLIKPYMSDELKAQFTEDYFQNLRELTLRNYGKLKGFTYEGNETQDDLLRLKYTVETEKGSFPVLLVYHKGKLVGLALGVVPEPNPLGMVAAMGGALIALVGVYLLRKKLSFPELALGSGLALVLSIILPFYSLTGTLLLPRVVATPVVSLLSALTIEVGKYYLAKNRDGLSLGLGLGIGQFVLLAIGTFVATNFIMKLPVSFTGNVLPLFLEAVIFTVFYALSTEVYSKRRDLMPFAVFTAFEFLSLYSLGLGSVYGSLTIALAGVAVAWKLGGE
ncbi:DUF3887 domain-containing protein [Thermococcus sp. Bubb.Bath]|uniref:DUF3887 domain-containing protein n=1 Tax=Thermococcus sp. Bubb.Bath TaxID=1638242 RepID=UPI00143A4451|nr:DUF3887 domain-containing protein [Thermococcus sp. Bubb.Bath]NJF24212.1 DUF3887 domain-containing protein [Thermococcus sp. Bubb.Bath]